jgi:hypothetical protein
MLANKVFILTAKNSKTLKIITKNKMLKSLAEIHNLKLGCVSHLVGPSFLVWSMPTAELSKLNVYCIQGVATEWFRFYVTDRKQLSKSKSRLIESPFCLSVCVSPVITFEPIRRFS